MKPREIQAQLAAAGHLVEMIDTRGLGRRGTSGLDARLPELTTAGVWLWLLEALAAVACLAASRTNGALGRGAHGLLLPYIMKARAHRLAATLHRVGTDVVICESNLDLAIALEGVASKRILDLPAPLADELYFGRLISRRGRDRVRRLERQAWSAASHLGFHWPTYADYVRRNLYSGDNFFNGGYGVHEKTRRAVFDEPPRIVFLGNLSDPWVNIELLAALTRVYPYIDVWGGPPPPAALGLNYRGYAPSLDILADYQIGLVTFSDDPLRRSGFSSKHLEYLSYGLPVLSPEWRSDPLLQAGTVSYNMESFVRCVASLSDRVVWRAASEAALASAATFAWANALSDLRRVVADEIDGPV